MFKFSVLKELYTYVQGSKFERYTKKYHGDIQHWTYLTVTGVYGFQHYIKITISYLFK